MRTLLAATALTTAIATFAAPAFAASVTDAMFNNPNVPRGGEESGSDASGTGYTFSRNAGVQQADNDLGFYSYNVSGQTGFIQNTANIQLDVTGLTVGDTYSFTFSLAAPSAPDEESEVVSNVVTDGFFEPDTVDVTFGANDFGTFASSSSSLTSFTTTDFTATSATGTLEFQGLDGSGGGALVVDAVGPTPEIAVDNVSVNLISAAPEPSVWALMIAGVAMVGGMLRYGRRRGAHVTA